MLKSQGELLERVADRAHAHDLAAGLGYCSGEQVAVAVDDLAEGNGTARCHELTAGRHDDDPRAGPGRNGGTVAGRDEGEISGRDDAAAGNRQGALSEVFAGPANVAAGCRVRSDDDGRCSAIGLLDGHDAVGTSRHWRSGHDACRASCRDRHADSRTGGQVVHHRERDLAGGVRKICRPHRVAVHRGVVEPGHRPGRDDVLGHDEPK